MTSPDAKYGFNDLAYGRIKAALGSTDTYFELIKGNVYPFLPGWASSKELFSTFRGPDGSLEIIKIIDIIGHRLTVERGQDGTVARNWPPGALLTQRSAGANLGKIMQKGEFREVSYNPDKILVPNYPGEKVYQNGAESCQKRWFINRAGNGVDRWGPLAGDLCGWESLDAEGYIQFGPWVDRTDDTYWQCLSNCLAWNGTYWQNNGPTIAIETTNRATYWAGYRPTYISLDFVDAVTYHVQVYTGTDGSTTEGMLAVEFNYSPLDLLELDWTGLFEDVVRIDISPNAGADVKITEIKFIGAY